MFRHIFKPKSTIPVPLNQDGFARVFQLHNPVSTKPVANHIVIGHSSNQYELVCYGKTVFYLDRSKHELTIFKREFDKSKTNSKYQKVFLQGVFLYDYEKEIKQRVGCLLSLSFVE